MNDKILSAVSVVFEIEVERLLTPERGEFLRFANLTASFLMKHFANLNGVVLSLQKEQGKHFTNEKGREFVNGYLTQPWFRKLVAETLIRLGEDEGALNFLMLAVA